MKRSQSCVRSDRNGFTLLELLVVIALMGVATSLGMSMFFKVSDAWRRTETRTELDARADAIFEQMRIDLSQVLSTKVCGYAIRGASQTAQDPRFFRVPLKHDRIVIPAKNLGQPGQPAQYANVCYHIERHADLGGYDLVRTTGPLGPKPPEGSPLKVGGGVLAMRIEYQADEKDRTWQPDWSRANQPAAVRVSLTLMNENRVHEQIARKAVFPIMVD